MPARRAMATSLAALALLVNAARGADEPAWLAITATGGPASVDVFSENAFAQHVPGIDAVDLARFAYGNHVFRTAWVTAPGSVPLFDGLGPFFSARSCSACHRHDGRGRPPADPDDRESAMIVKLGMIAAEGRPEPDPNYGRQLSEYAIEGLAPEGRLAVSWRERVVSYPDGDSVRLREPRGEFRDLRYGAMSPATRFSLRIAPAVIGAGLLEMVPDSELVARSDPDDRDGDGISGRAARVIDPVTHAVRVGRFGWKATQPTVLAQLAAALSGDIGITTPVVPELELMPGEGAARARPDGGAPELEGEALDALVGYCQLLAVPARRDADRPAVRRGGATFARIGCTACHAPDMTTGDGPTPALARHEFHPMSDLLLHDMGPSLSDGLPEGDASASEWRTPPLWGLGLLDRVDGYRFLLHDGRARTPEEAILWHGGEAGPARKAFMDLDRADRADLLAFLESL